MKQVFSAAEESESADYLKLAAKYRYGLTKKKIIIIVIIKLPYYYIINWFLFIPWLCAKVQLLLSQGKIPCCSLEQFATITCGRVINTKPKDYAFSEHLLQQSFHRYFARKAFPCSDEPDFMSKFSIRIVKPNDTYTSLSNMNIIVSVFIIFCFYLFIIFFYYHFRKE